jgi:3-methyladenine DNA glycosylase AlkD
MSAATDVMAELALLEDPKLRAANEERGDDHGVNLTAMRAVAKRLKAQHELAKELWATGDTAARLLATLIARPKAFSADELGTMIHDIRTPKLLDWFITNIVKPGKHTEELRLRWKDGTDLVGRAGWSLTTDRVVKNADGLDLGGLLDQIEVEMKDAPAPKQWPMNHCLAEIGIRHPPYARAPSALAKSSRFSSTIRRRRVARRPTLRSGLPRWCVAKKRRPEGGQNSRPIRR